MYFVLKRAVLLLTLSYNIKSTSISRPTIHPVKQKLNSSIFSHEFHVYNYPRRENTHVSWKLRDFLRLLTESWRPTTTTHLLLHSVRLNPLNAKLNPIRHLLAKLARHILHVSRIRVTAIFEMVTKSLVSTLCLSISFPIYVYHP